MSNLAHKLDPQVESFKSELSQMISTAKTPEDRIALKAFAQAMAPYFEKPEQLRSGLGKIMQTFISSDVQKDIQTREFSSLEELKAILPSDVSVRVES